MAQGDLVKSFLEHRDVVLSYIFALTRDYDIAEEIFQNVAVAILEEAGRPPRIEHFPAWLREVARHRVADYYRKNARRLAKEEASGSLAEVVSLAFTENPIPPDASQQRMKSLLECLQRLTGRSRDVIEGFYRDQKSLKELAASLSWKEDSIKVALSRARKALADCVAVKLRTQQTE